MSNQAEKETQRFAVEKQREKSQEQQQGQEIKKRKKSNWKQ